MRTQIYFIRHGESQANKKNVFIGHTDLDLTEKGHLQAEKTAEYLKDIHADVIYSSDLLRAYNTSVHTAKMKGIEVIKNKNLREIFAGDWENIPFATLVEEYKEEYGVWLKNIGLSKCSNGESVQEMQKRFVGEVEKIAKANEGKTILIFTHATPIRVAKAAWDGVAAEGIKDIPWATNASVTHAEYSCGRFRIVDYSIDSFMGEMRTALPDNV